MANLQKFYERRDKFLARFSNQPLMARNYVSRLNRFRLFLFQNSISVKEISELSDLHSSSITRILELCYVPSAPIFALIEESALTIYFNRLKLKKEAEASLKRESADLNSSDDLSF